jgi:hypothetical protein
LFSEKEETMAGPSSRVCRVLMSGPLAPFADAFAAELRGRGYTPLTTVNLLRQVAWLSRWLEAGGLSAADLSEERVEEFLAWQRVAGRGSQQSRPGVSCLLEVLHGLGVLAVESSVPACSSRDLLLASFERYLLGERALAEGTVHGYVMHARWFLEPDEGREPALGEGIAVPARRAEDVDRRRGLLPVSPWDHVATARQAPARRVVTAEPSADCALPQRLPRRRLGSHIPGVGPHSQRTRPAWAGEA